MINMLYNFCKPRLVLVVVLLFFSTSTTTFAQRQPSVDTLFRKFSAYRNTHLPEKLFVHIDRTTHLCGETLWFKLYCVNGITHQPLDLSKVAYVEIISDSGASVLQAKIELKGATGTGSFFLPVSLRSGNYVLRAYTQWMKNNDETWFFSQPISIINTFHGSEIQLSAGNFDYDAQLLPEGGNLVSGIKSRVGFRVTDGTGSGIAFKGAVLNHTGDTVVRFSPAHFGIGAFEITPLAGEAYRVVIQDRSGRVNLFPFPRVFDEGYTLRVDKSGDRIQVNVRGTGVATEGQTISLFIHTRTQVAVKESGKLLNGQWELTLSEKTLKAGISHITLFDAKLNPVCERLIFKSPDEKLIISPGISSKQNSIRKPVRLTIDVTNEVNKPTDAELSVAVYKLDSLPAFSQPGIQAYLLLSSDLRGSIESPEFYLQAYDREAIDALMLTHGWRRFRWEDVLHSSAEWPRYKPESLGLTVNGKLTALSGQVSNTQLLLSIPSQNSLFFTTHTRASGEFTFLLKNVYGDRSVILQPNLAKDSLNVYQFTVDDPFVKEKGDVILKPFRLDIGLEKALIERSMNFQAADIFKKQVPQVRRVTDSTSFYGTADETYLLDDYTRFTILEEVLREYVPGVLVRKRRGEFSLGVRDIVNHGVFKEEPLRLIDGVPVFDSDKIMEFDPLRVKKLEVVSKLFFHGQDVFPGIVSLTTYTGDLAGFEVQPQSVTLDFSGFQVTREFYHPRYESEEARQSREPDARTLLNWVPQVLVKNGRAEVDFFTSDQEGIYQIVIEGLNSTGRMGSARATFEVKDMR